MKRKMFLSNPIHMVKDYELKKLLWQAGGGVQPKQRSI